VTNKLMSDEPRHLQQRGTIEVLDFEEHTDLGKRPARGAIEEILSA